MATATITIIDTTEDSVQIKTNLGMGRNNFNFLDDDVTTATQCAIVAQKATDFSPHPMMALLTAIEERDMKVAMYALAFLMKEDTAEKRNAG